MQVNCEEEISYSAHRLKGGTANGGALESSRPLITFALFTYNQEKYIVEAIEGALSQTYSPLEIVFSDDNSTDSTFDIIEKMVGDYTGPHRIIVNRNINNLGLSDHVNKMVDLATGEIIALAAGDDISLPSRVEDSWKILSKHPDCSCVSFSTIKFKKKEFVIIPDKYNNIRYKRYSVDNLIIDCDFHTNGAARSFRKGAFTRFGNLNPETPTEDSTILLRCMLSGSVIQAENINVLYRVHGENYYASDKKHRINYEDIHKQYISDLNIALNDGLIGKNLFRKIEASLEKRLKKRNLRSGFFFSRNRLSYFAVRILFSRTLRVKEKLRYLKKLFSSAAV